MKIIVTHIRPDLDAVTSVWVIKRFLPNWEGAQVHFVGAGTRFDGSIPKEEIKGDPIEKIQDDEVIHVDTGLGPLDHHQTSDDTTCGAKRTWEWAKTKTEINEHIKEAGDRLMNYVVDIDHFKNCFWPDANTDRYEMSVTGILDGLKFREEDDYKVVEAAESMLDSIIEVLRNKIWAEEEIKKTGKEFHTKWGKALALETVNDETMHLAQMMGYKVVVRKDPHKGYVRIKSIPDKAIDLTPIYEKLTAIDPNAHWFLHVSKHMLLNGSSKNPGMQATTLPLDKILEVVTSV